MRATAYTGRQAGVCRGAPWGASPASSCRGLRSDSPLLHPLLPLVQPVAPPPAPLGPSHSAFEVPPGGGGTGGGGATPEVARLKVQVVDLAGQVARQQADAAVYADHARVSRRASPFRAAALCTFPFLWGPTQAKYAKLVVSTGLLMDRQVSRRPRKSPKAWRRTPILSSSSPAHWQRDYKSRVEATLVGITKAVTAASSSAESPAQLEALATIARAVEGLREVTI